MIEKYCAYQTFSQFFPLLNLTGICCLDMLQKRTFHYLLQGHYYIWNQTLPGLLWTQLLWNSRNRLIWTYNSTVKCPMSTNTCISECNIRINRVKAKCAMRTNNGMAKCPMRTYSGTASCAIWTNSGTSVKFIYVSTTWFYLSCPATFYVIHSMWLYRMKTKVF